ncbi:MAG TPA: hypothetical protein VN675_01325 [Burkholderiales bacterium]|nr:hypothetical protein [Burkholderiales bacterium]
MEVRQLTLLAAALIASAPAQADELQVQSTVPMTMLYVSVPIGATNAKERALAYGFALQGKRQYETVYLDSRMFNAFEGMLAGIEAKWLIAGGLAVAGGVYMSRKDGGRSDGYSSSQNNQQNNPPPAPPPCTDPCAKK